MGEEWRDRFFSPLRARVTERITESLRRGGAPRRLPVDRRDALSPKQFKREYLAECKPVVMAGAAARNYRPYSQRRKISATAWAGTEKVRATLNGTFRVTKNNYH